MKNKNFTISIALLSLLAFSTSANAQGWRPSFGSKPKTTTVETPAQETLETTKTIIEEVEKVEESKVLEPKTAQPKAFNPYASGFNTQPKERQVGGVKSIHTPEEKEPEKVKAEIAIDEVEEQPERRSKIGQRPPPPMKDISRYLRKESAPLILKQMEASGIEIPKNIDFEDSESTQKAILGVTKKLTPEKDAVDPTRENLSSFEESKQPLVKNTIKQIETQSGIKYPAMVNESMRLFDSSKKGIGLE